MLPRITKAMHTGFENHIGVLSLTENPHNLLMWAHYADSHQGFVIQFDASHKFFYQRKSKDDQLRHLRPVSYSRDRPSLTLSQVNGLDYCLAKSMDWSYEKEWRLIFSLADSNEKIKAEPYDVHLFKIPFEAMTSVIIGARSIAKTVSQIKEVLSANIDLSHISLFQMEVHEERFELVMKQL